ncbi:PREDICTED: gamma-aminobutyric acid type B receptor subunit 2-like [Priapulus caudatus]|uniref:Gamma-aminobutyric acid type B receptor subunit 2-like n=1 Tax=Priapulus caudatus TaxID=37621 RepID=A0ABM1END0_PRICU|nr:PREDICTED: gamma-aminobutyric acid type B receptor subunit 2-like [Priapulus caudatus]
MFLGLKSDVFLGLKSDVFLGLKSDVFLGLKSDVFLGLKSLQSAVMALKPELPIPQPDATFQSGCDPGRGIHALYEALYKDPVKVAVIGDPLSPVSEATGQVIHFWNVIMCAAGAASPNLSNKKKYPWFFRTIGSQNAQNPTYVEIIQTYGWTRVACIHESVGLFSSAMEDVIPKLEAANITIITSEIFTDNPVQQIANIKRHDGRIIIGFFYEDMAVKVFCEAYKAGIYGAHYQWLITGFYSKNWWLIDTPRHGCLPDQIAAAVVGVLTFAPSWKNPTRVVGISGLTTTEVFSEYELRSRGRQLFAGHQIGLCYDAVWIVALMLNRSQQIFEEKGFGRGLEDFHYSDKEMAHVMFDVMTKVEGWGVRGYLKFDENHDIPETVQIRQVQADRKWRTVGYYLPQVGETPARMRWLEGSPIIWQGGGPPKDSVLRILIVQKVNPLIYGVMCALATTGILLAFLFLTCNAKYRKHSVMKASSPTMNGIILFGCILSYSAIYFEFTHADDHKEMLCKLSIWTLTIGSGMALSSLFLKAWRIYYVFTNVNLQKRVITDKKLIAAVVAVTAVNMLVLCTWEAVDPLSVTVYNATVLVSEENYDVNVINQVQVCKSASEAYFLGPAYAIQSLLLAFGTFIAYETRKVKVEEFNDSKLIATCIYNYVIFGVVGVGVVMMMGDMAIPRYVVKSACVIFATTLTQSIIFVPKIIARHRTTNAIEVTQHQVATAASIAPTSQLHQLHGVSNATDMHELSTVKEQLAQAQTENKTLSEEIHRLRRIIEESQASEAPH